MGLEEGPGGKEDACVPHTQFHVSYHILLIIIRSSSIKVSEERRNRIEDFKIQMHII